MGQNDKSAEQRKAAFAGGFYGFFGVVVAVGFVVAIAVAALLLGAGIVNQVQRKPAPPAAEVVAPEPYWPDVCALAVAKAAPEHRFNDLAIDPEGDFRIVQSSPRVLACPVRVGPHDEKAQLAVTLLCADLSSRACVQAGEVEY